jgi:group I intron endonuclease
MPYKVKLCGIYKIQRVGSTDCYVGQAKNIFLRWNVHRHHLRKGKHHSPYFQNAFRKYGEEAFVFEIIELFDVYDRFAVTAAEQRWIDTLKPVYNIVPSAVPGLHIVFSDETRKKMSIAKKNKPLSLEHRAHLAAAQRAYHEERKRLGLPHPRAGKPQKPRSQETRQKMSVAQKGRFHPKASNETKAKMSASRMGKPGTMKGKKHSPATRAQMSRAHVARWAARKAICLPNQLSLVF